MVLLIRPTCQTNRRGLIVRFNHNKTIGGFRVTAHRFVVSSSSSNSKGIHRPKSLKHDTVATWVHSNKDGEICHASKNIKGLDLIINIIIHMPP